MKYYNPRKTKIFPKEGSFQEGKVLGASFPGGGNVLSSRSRQRIQRDSAAKRLCVRSLKLTAKALENQCLEDEISFWGKRPNFRGDLLVSGMAV